MNDRIRLLEILLDFTEHTYFSQSIKELVQQTADFFAQRFGLSNCLVELYGIHHRYLTNGTLSQFYGQVEHNLIPHIVNSKTPLYIANPLTDPYLRGIVNFAGVQDSVAHCISAFPIVHDRTHIGHIFLYGNTTFATQGELFNKIIEKLLKAAIRVKNYSEVKHSAITDQMTGLYNKTYFHETLKTEVGRAMADKKPTSLVIIDIDNFKNYNDTKGHLEGDVLLKALAALIKEHVSPLQIASRFGGEEFVMLLPTTPTQEAYDWAEDFRIDVEKKLGQTISIGVCTCTNSSANASDMMKRADEALYRSKRSGKNKTTQVAIIDKALAPVDVHH